MKSGVFHKNKCYDPLFAEFSSILHKKRQIFATFLAKKKLKSYVCNISPKQFFQVPPLSNQKPFLRGSVIPLPVGFTYVPTYRQVAILL
jgi:hypothetical protein